MIGDCGGTMLAVLLLLADLVNCIATIGANVDVGDNTHA